MAEVAPAPRTPRWLILLVAAMFLLNIGGFAWSTHRQSTTDLASARRLRSLSLTLADAKKDGAVTRAQLTRLRHQYDLTRLSCAKAKGCDTPPSAAQVIEQTGSQGARGPQGITGDRGPKGDRGDPGGTGSPGQDGKSGTAGTNGANGVGQAGVNGKDGKDGASGVPGPVGPAGPVGPTGAQGEKGDVGPAGPTGPAAVAIRVPDGLGGFCYATDPDGDGTYQCP